MEKTFIGGVFGDVFIMSKVLISPWARQLRNGKENPKNYPYWLDLVNLLQKNNIFTTQIGTNGEKLIGADAVLFKDFCLEELEQQILSNDLWISVDSFFQHFASLYKSGIVIWSQSSYNIFGYKKNINLLKSETYLRDNQFGIWEECEYKADAFVEPNIVLKHVLLQLES